MLFVNLSYQSSRFWKWASGATLSFHKARRISWLKMSSWSISVFTSSPSCLSSSSSSSSSLFTSLSYFYGLSVLMLISLVSFCSVCVSLMTRRVTSSTNFHFFFSLSLSSISLSLWFRSPPNVEHWTETREFHETSDRHDRQRRQGQEGRPRVHLLQTELQTQVVPQERRKTHIPSFIYHSTHPSCRLACSSSNWIVSHVKWMLLIIDVIATGTVHGIASQDDGGSGRLSFNDYSA